MRNRPPNIDGLAASTLQLPTGAWLTVLDCLCERFSSVPRAQWVERMARDRVVDSDGRSLTPETPYRVGLEVHYYREVPDEAPIPFDEVVLHEDPDLLVVDKPHFLPVTPAGAHVHETLLGRLIRRTGNDALAPLHRIDRDTAGLVLFSANPGSRARYQALFRERRINKSYEAIAAALPDVEFPCIRTSRIVTGDPFFRMQEIEGPANSETRIEVIERGNEYWRYALTPITGRKHQLRVHMAAMGAPIANDNVYPSLHHREAGDYSAPLQLLAKHLTFIDPLSGVERSYTSGFRLRGFPLFHA
ncbi:pseudouridine synthase [Solilutibacter silvestris]|uniref:Pseudouridylate synthases 23S RNA-specific n=1 Tax=Solilutibacter silvestris TaxID=1645665 RepID=A0A2K1Q2B5_9GAMM|nr:pseudouridine synthase [Lysobacter silvestris]PNS09097.1 Pseudouridylate synthases 23S RNA-specific [Lysobacter silvestris]